MKKTMRWLNFLVGLWLSVSVVAQTVPSTEKMPVNERMAKARASKADKKLAKVASPDASGSKPTLSPNKADSNGGNTTLKETKATPADYRAPVIKSQKGPNGEVVYTGERGGKYYINKNGNKTYLSSNQ